MPVRAMAMLLLMGVLAGCGPQEPLRIGFIGGLSGRVSDLGIGGRNGVQLAVDVRNAAGGIHGRRIELLTEDDQQDPEVAKQAVARLIGHKPVALIGPMTSSIALTVLPQVNAANLLMISPTVTTNALSGKDDYFFRVVSSTRRLAHVSAGYHVDKKNVRRVAAILDTRNRAYTEDWLNDYRAALEAKGGTVVQSVEFASSDNLRFSELAKQLLASRPDCVLVLANSVDTAMVLQQIRKLDSDVLVAGPEWAATERLIELAGKSAEGFIAGQFYDRQGGQPAYVAFRKAYLERFGLEPGFAGMTGFDAANVLLDAMTKQPAGQSLRQMLAGQAFSGAQTQIVFDAHGDVVRPTFITTIRNGRFVVTD